VKIKGTVSKMYVTFGEIRIPASAVRGRPDLAELGKKYGCKIVDTGQYLRIVPNVVEEIIKKDGALASSDPEHQEELKKWVVTNLKNMLIDLRTLSC